MITAEQQFHLASIKMSLESTHTNLQDMSDEYLVDCFKSLRRHLKFVVEHARDSQLHERAFTKQWEYAKEFRNRGIDFKPYLKVDNYDYAE
jgi:hypothetical protein